MLLDSPRVWGSGKHGTPGCSLPAQSGAGSVSLCLMAHGTQLRLKVPDDKNVFRKHGQQMKNYRVGLRTSSDGEEDVLCSRGTSSD